jgi:SAM-dependent methyltransferase
MFRKIPGIQAMNADPIRSAQRSFALALALGAAASFAFGGEPPPQDEATMVRIPSGKSIVSFNFLDNFNISAAGKQAAAKLLESLATGDRRGAEEARRMYEQLIPRENFGGEYSALAWFCDYLLAPPEARKAMLADKFTAHYFHFFGDNNFAALKEYLQRKYGLPGSLDMDSPKAIERRNFLIDLILFNNPRRNEWEKTDKILAVLPLRPGDRVADIGSGPGYYTFKFAEMVGPTGRIYAIETVPAHLRYIADISRNFAITNVLTRKDTESDVGLDPEQVDVAFMCSVYHFLYIAVKDEIRDAFIKSVYRSLKKDGTLIVVDNAVVPDGLSYHGPHLAPELIIAQLKYYGFRLVNQYAFIPQRYVLIFKKG